MKRIRNLTVASALVFALVFGALSLWTATPASAKPCNRGQCLKDYRECLVFCSKNLCIIDCETRLQICLDNCT